MTVSHWLSSSACEPPPLTQIVRRDEWVEKLAEGISNPVNVKPVGLKVMQEKWMVGKVFDRLSVGDFLFKCISQWSLTFSVSNFTFFVNVRCLFKKKKKAFQILFLFNKNLCFGICCSISKSVHQNLRFPTSSPSQQHKVKLSCLIILYDFGVSLLAGKDEH